MKGIYPPSPAQLGCTTRRRREAGATMLYDNKDSGVHQKDAELVMECLMQQKNKVAGGG